MPQSTITGIGGVSGVSVADISSAEADFVSIDDRLRDMFSSASVSTQNAYNEIMAKAMDPEFISRPGGLFELQVQLGEYRYQVETISALTRKGVATVETLLRS